MNDDLKPYKNILANVARHITLSEEEKSFLFTFKTKEAA